MPHWTKEYLDADAWNALRADGGCFDWLTRLGNDRRLVLVASAIGSQLIAQLFAPVE
jgi:hypothetical protein